MRTLARQINILDYALSSLWRRRLKNASVLVVFTAVIFLVASFQMVTDALTGTAQEVLVNAPQITLQRMSAGRQVDIPLAYAGKLGAIYGISNIVPRVWGYYFDELTGANLTIMGLDTSRMPLGDQLRLTLAEGTFPAAGSRGSVVLGQAVRDMVRARGSQLLSLFRNDLSMASYQVAGVFSRATDILTRDLVVMGIADARDLFRIPPGQATDLCIYVANPTEIGTIARKIADLLPDTRVVTRPQILKTYRVVFGWRSGFGSICLLTALTAFVILAWDKASGLSLEEKREIAILKVLGWQTADILAVRFWESLLVSGLAFLLGVTLAYVHVVFLDGVLFRPVMVGWSVIFPPFHLAPAMNAQVFFLIFCLSVLPYLAATVIPAWHTATVRADSALSGA